MTREIKFRYYDVNPGIWAFRFENVDVTSDPDAPIHSRVPRNVVRFDAVGLVQFTGLKDKNGKEIYEGDVVLDSTPFIENFPNIKQPVKYEILIASHLEILYKTLDGGWIESGQDKERILKVIGNIYENPELLRRRS